MLHLLVLADVAHDGGHADDAALFVANGGCGQGNVYRRAVLANAKALVADVLAGTHAAVDVLELGPRVRGIEYAHRAADGLVRGVAEHALRRRIPRQDGADGCQADDGVVSRRGNGCQSGVGLLGLLALGDVEGDAENGMRDTVGPAAHLTAAIDPPDLAVAPNDAELLGVGIAVAAHGRLVAGAKCSAVVRMDAAQHLVRRAGELLPPETEQPVHRVGPRDAVGGDVPLPDADAGRREHQGQVLERAAELAGGAGALARITAPRRSIPVGLLHRRLATGRPRIQCQRHAGRLRCG